MKCAIIIAGVNNMNKKLSENLKLNFLKIEDKYFLDECYVVTDSGKRINCHLREIEKNLGIEKRKELCHKNCIPGNIFIL